MRTKRALLMALSAGLAASASAQIDLYLVNTQDLDLLSDDAAFWLGNNPSCVAYDGNNMYVGGFLNGSTPAEITDFTVQIIRVENPLGARTFTELTATRASVPASRGYTGLDWDDEKGLLATADFGGSAEGSVKALRFDPGTNAFIKFQQTPSSAFTTRGSTGPSWDHGPNGTGFDYLPFNPPEDGAPNPDGTNDGALPAITQFSETEVLGLFEDLAQGLCTLPDTSVIITDETDCLNQGGTFNDDSDFILNADIGRTFYPDFAPAVQLSNDGQGTLWRDLDIHPGNGDIAARSNNQLVLISRNADGSALGIGIGDRITPAGGTAPFVNGHNCAIMHGAPSGDIVAWNDRGTGGTGQSFSNVVIFNDLDTGASVTPTWFDDTGMPLTFGAGNAIPDGNGYYDFFWHEPTSLLLVCDFNNRNVYFFSTEAPAPDCLCEFGGDPAVVSVEDLLAFLALWFPGDSGADIDGLPGVDVLDLLEFLACWFAATGNAGICN